MSVFLVFKLVCSLIDKEVDECPVGRRVEPVSGLRTTTTHSAFPELGWFIQYSEATYGLQCGHECGPRLRVSLD